MTVSCFRVVHRIECWGFLFREKDKLRKVDLDKTREFEVPAAFFPRLKEGSDYIRQNGDLVKNEWVTRPAPHARSYAYCADTRYEPALCDMIRDIDLVYHESTYLHDQVEKAGSRFHSTAAQAASIANQAGAKKLLLGHFSSKYTDLNPFLEEARAIFPAADLAIEGTTYIVG
jgi:ribonuclease Z